MKYYDNLSKEPKYNLKRLESTPTTFCLNPPKFDKGKKLIIPNLTRSESSGTHRGEGKYGMRTINVRIWCRILR